MALRELVDATETARGRAAKMQNLHPTDMACLAYLQRVGRPISPKQISTHLNLTSGSGTALLDRLEAVGYTRRLPNPEDRRSILIELDVEKAKEPLARLAKFEKSYLALTETFSERDLWAISKFLDEMNGFAKQMAES
ncbi:MarR family transcriptional regulator [Devosia sp. 2618]|uniref:MarR family winged helix-turn-helix transcriptional regulator n=1 Tax=Devosia sp. 2618 TaxID=3156454 RepID=UPI003396CE6D